MIIIRHHDTRKTLFRTDSYGTAANWVMDTYGQRHALTVTRVTAEAMALDLLEGRMPERRDQKILELNIHIH